MSTSTICPHRLHLYTSCLFHHDSFYQFSQYLKIAGWTPSWTGLVLLLASNIPAIDTAKSDYPICEKPRPSPHSQASDIFLMLLLSHSNTFKGFSDFEKPSEWAILTKSGYMSPPRNALPLRQPLNSVLSFRSPLLEMILTSTAPSISLNSRFACSRSWFDVSSKMSNLNSPSVSQH